MEQVAEIFNKKLNEEFTIECGGRRYKAYFKILAQRMNNEEISWFSLFLWSILAKATPTLYRFARTPRQENMYEEFATSSTWAVS